MANEEKPQYEIFSKQVTKEIPLPAEGLKGILSGANSNNKGGNTP